MTKLSQNILEWTLPNGDVAQTSVWWLVGDSATPDAVNGRIGTTLLDEIWPSTSGGIKPEFPAGVVLSRYVTRFIDPSTGGTTGVSEALVTRNGTGSGSPLPPEVSVCVSLKTTASGASGRGRCYLPPLIVGSLSSTGGLDSGHAGDLADGWAAGLTALNADTTFTVSEVCVYSRKLHSVAPVIACRVGTTFDAQRRRRNVSGESYATASV